MNTDKEFSQVAQELKNHEKEPSRDYVGKMLFRNKEVLAVILHDLIDEFKGCTLADIRDVYLEQKQILVNEGKYGKSHEVAAPQVVGAATESKNQYGRGIEYDVLLMLPVPGRSDSRVGVIINIEIQNKIRTQNGHLFKRMVYYAANLITAQKGTIFSGDDYGNLCRVYSVWLCPMVTQDQPAIDLFGLSVSRIFGEGNPDMPPEYYDLQKILFCRFNLYSQLQGASIQRFLQLLLTECAPVDERLNELHNDYGITITKESETMCNLTYELYMHAKHEGEMEGEMKGRKEGEIKGRKEGEIKGRKEGEIKGRKEGEIKGRKEGEIKGRKEGEIKGKTELRLEIYRKMKDNHMDDNIIMNVLNINSEQLFALQQTSITETMSVPGSGPSLQEQ